MKGAQNPSHHTFNMNMDDFQDGFYCFAMFRALNGPVSMPNEDSGDATIADGLEFSEEDLYRWMKRQCVARKNFVQGGSSGITAEQVKLLDSISFPWERSAFTADERWDHRFDELQDFKNKNGHCNPTTPRSELTNWVKNLRAAHKRNTLTADKIFRLEEIGFKWKLYDDWKEKFELLEFYAEDKGDCLVPRQHSTLGRWVAEQRVMEKKRRNGEKSSMTDERYRKLEDIGFIWEINKLSTAHTYV